MKIENTLVDVQNNKIKKAAFFAAISAFIGVFEGLILPLPLFKLGLSNIPVMLGFSFFNFYYSLYIVLFKVIFTHLFRGTLFSYPFLIALSGNLLFVVFGYFFYKLFKNYISFISLSVIGSLLHNTGQLLVASIFIPLKPLYFLGSILVFTGLILGFINGIFCNIIYNKIIVRYFND